MNNETPASYDAILPLIQKQDDELKLGVEHWCACYHPYDATPRQLCEALLKATGKWEVEKP